MSCLLNGAIISTAAGRAILKISTRGQLVNRIRSWKKRNELAADVDILR